MGRLSNPVLRRLTDAEIKQVIQQYRAGASLAVVAGAFGLHDRTLAREFRRAGVPIRPRRGWHT